MQKLTTVDGFVFYADSFKQVENGFVGEINGEFIEYPNAVSAGAKIEDCEPPQPTIPPPEVENRWITKAAFRNRFTDAEKITSELMSIDNPSDALQKRQIAAALRVANADVVVATYIDLERPDTIKGVRMMESIGVIAKGRADEILLAEITDIERFMQ